MKKILLALSLGASLFAGSIEVNEPYVKITPPNAKNSAIFMSIKNNSNEDIKLIDAKCDFAQSTEIHTHIHEDGMLKMIRIQDATIPANSSLELKPKSYHVMLMGIKDSVKEDTKLNLELSFSNGEKLKLKDIPAKAVVPMHH